MNSLPPDGICGNHLAFRLSSNNNFIPDRIVGLLHNFGWYPNSFSNPHLPVWFMSKMKLHPYLDMFLCMKDRSFDTTTTHDFATISFKLDFVSDRVVTFFDNGTWQPAFS